ncbi:MAG: hypothetical protein R6V56_00765 [Lentisphaeria bacterium]
MSQGARQSELYASESASAEPVSAAERLAWRLGKKVDSVTLTNNRCTMLSWRRIRSRKFQVRLHHMFSDAPDNIIGAIRKMLEGDDSGRAEVRGFIRAHGSKIKETANGEKESSRRVICRPVGVKFDLREIHKEVNETYFNGSSTAAVTWGKALPRRAVKNLRFGSYSPEKNLITISRRLNARDIPRYMVQYIVFHEILHEMIGIKEGKGGRRRRLHPPEFRRRERQFRYLQKARQFMADRWGVKP